jgi:hypothetical protein
MRSNIGFLGKKPKLGCRNRRAVVFLRTATSYRQRITATESSSIEFSLVSAIFTPKAGRRFTGRHSASRIAFKEKTWQSRQLL